MSDQVEVKMDAEAPKTVLKRRAAKSLLRSHSEPDLRLVGVDLSNRSGSRSEKLPSSLEIVQEKYNLFTAGKVVRNDDLSQKEASNFCKCCSEGNHVERVTLMEWGWPIDAIDKDGVPPLFRASSGGHHNIGSHLIQCGTDVSAPHYKETALHTACRNGHLQVVRIFIDAGCPINMLDERCTPLMEAAHKGHTDIVDHLLTCGASVNTIDSKSRSALHCASKEGHVEVVHSLLKAGADVDALSYCNSTSGEQCYTALYLACAHGHLHVVKVLVEAGSKINEFNFSFYTPLMIAAWEGHSDIVDHLLTCGALVNLIDPWSRTALHLAILSGHVDIVMRLLKAGADVVTVPFFECNYGIKDGIYRALHLACSVAVGHLEIVKALIKSGCKIDQLDGRQLTPLMAAASEGHTDIVDHLLTCGASVNTTGSLSRTALHCASVKGHVEVVHSLLKAGADVDALCNYNSTSGERGDTALHLACSHGNLQVVKVLVEAGSNINEFNCDLCTPLMIAASESEGHTDIVDHLLTCGASVNTTGSLRSRRALHCASKEGHVEVVHSLLKAGADVDALSYCNSASGEQCYTALYLACAHGHLHVVKVLVEAGSKINELNFSFYTPLMIATWEGHIDIVDHLLSCGASVNTTGSLSRSSLHLAVQSGHVDIVLRLLEAGADMDALSYCCNSTSGEQGDTALYLACSHGHLQVVKVLVEAGSKINKKSFYTPLMIAAWEGHTDIVDHLLTCGALVNIIDPWCRTALHLAILSGHVDIVMRLVEVGADVDALFEVEHGIKDGRALRLACSVAVGHLEIVKALIKAGCRIDQLDGRQLTPLMAAASEGHTDIVDHLLTCGAPVNTIGSLSRSALHCASKEGHVEVVHSLLKAGADVHALTNVDKSGERGDTALHLACYRGHLQVVKVLVEAGSEIGAFDRIMDTPLIIASMEGHTDIVDHLLTCGAPVNTIGSLSRSALHYASVQGCVDVVHSLLKAGADVDALSHDSTSGERGDTALHLACYSEHLQVVKVLVEAGSEISAFDRIMDTPLIIAAMEGHTDIVDHLLTCGAPVNTIGSLSRSALHCASKEGHVEVVHSLLKAGADVHALTNVDKSGRRGDTALHFACYHGHLQVVKVLVEAGSKIDAFGENMATSLMIAAEKGHTDIVDHLLTCGASVNTISLLSRSALHFAIEAGHVEIVIMLLEAGADADALLKDIIVHKDSEALHLACFAGRLEVVRTLICHTKTTSRIDHYDRHKLTPLMITADKGHTDIVDHLLTCGASVSTIGSKSRSALHCASEKGHVKVVRSLLKAGADVDALSDSTSGERGTTALHLACCHGHLQVVKVLVEAGSKINAFDGHGDTPLMLATLKDHNEIVDHLLTCGALVNETDFSRVYASMIQELESHSLYSAVSLGDIIKVRTILLEGFDVNKCNYRYGETALHLAAERPYSFECMKVLLDTALVDPVDNNHFTPLARAVVSRNYDSIAYLVHCGADVERLWELLSEKECMLGLSDLIMHNYEAATEAFISNFVGTRGLLSTTPPMTALMWAAQKGKDGLVKQLILEGVSLNKQNPDGNTALHFAAQHNHIQCGILLAEGGADVRTVSLIEENLEAQETVGTLHFVTVTAEFRAAILQTLSFQTKKTVCVIGNALSGKSTLIAALKLENPTFAEKVRTRLFGVQDITERTVGIEPVTISSKRFGEVMFFDFAGQHEYHGPHELFLESILSRGSVTVIMVVKATEDEPAISQQLNRWLHPFIQLPSSESPIGVVVVGSHWDKVKSKLEAEDKLELSLRKLKEDFSDLPVKFHDVCFLNCRRPQAKGISYLCQLLSRIPLPKYTATDSDYSLPWVISQIHSSVAVEALPLSALSQWITVNHSNLPAKLPPVDKLCSDLSSTGHFLYIPNKQDICKGWLVLDLPPILHKVYGTIFSPFNRVVNELGLLSCSRLPSLFPTFDPVMIRKILVSLNFCLELDSSLSTELAQIVDSGSDSSSVYLFFPSLVQAKRPDVFQQDVTGSFMLCWQLRVSTDMFISPRLLQTIILRLAARYVFHHKKLVESRSSACQLWWNGIYWPSTEDVDVAVQISNNAIVHVIGRSVVTPSALCAYLSTVTQSVLSTIQDVSPGLSCRACIVHPGCPRELLARPRAVSPQEMFPVGFILESRQKQAATCAPLKEGTERKFIKELFGFEPDADLIEKFDFMIHTDPTGQTVPEPASRLSTQPQPVSQPTTSQPFQQLLVDYKERICSEVDSDAICTRLEVENIISERAAHKINQVNRREGNDLLFLHLRKQGDIGTLKVFSEVLIQVGVEEGGYARMGRLGSCLLNSISELEDSASSSPVSDSEDGDMHSNITLVEHQDLLDRSLSSGSSTEALPM